MTEQGRAVLVVRNTANHDARVLRCAKTLRTLGYEPLVLAVTSEEERATRATIDGIPVQRLTPRAPFARLSSALRRSSPLSPRPLNLQAPPDRPVPKRLYGPQISGGSAVGWSARVYRLLRTLDYYRRGIAAVRALRPRLVHCNDYNTMWIGVAAKLLTGCALVYDSHELWPDRNGRSEPRWWLLACEALFLRLADASLATSPGHADTIARRHRVAPPLVVRNVAERAAAPQPADNGSPAANAAANAPNNPGALSSPATIAYVGAVTSHRGLEQAIAALPGAPGVALRIVGPGPEAQRALLGELTARRGVDGRVRIEPPVPPGGVAMAIRGADAGMALIQPACLSYALSLPNKLFEYMAAGLPVLAADVPVIRQFVEDHGVGIVVAPDDTAAIAGAMLELVEPGRNRQLREAVATAAAGLSWEREAELLTRAYREATAR